jgi:hypothetical protein
LKENKIYIVFYELFERPSYDALFIIGKLVVFGYQRILLRE